MLDFLYSFVLAFLTAILSLTVWPAFFDGLALALNLSLLFLVALAVFADWRLGWLYVLWSGLIYTLYSPSFFGFYFILFIVEFLVLRFSLRYFFHQQSLVNYLFLLFLATFIWRIFLSLGEGTSSFNLLLFCRLFAYQFSFYFFITCLVYYFYPPFKKRLQENLIK